MRMIRFQLLPVLLLLAGCQLLEGTRTAESPVVVPTAAPVTRSASAAFADVEAVVARVAPAVVHIRSQIVASSGFRQPFVQEGVGTGVIIASDGFILTNNHVIEGAREVTVTLPDGRAFERVQVVGRDPLSDLAVLRVEARGLPTAPFADPGQLRVGQWVVAIGNALNLVGGPTVTVGVISALGRSIDEPNNVTLIDLIQTDAAINPGNSGGPLLNLAGEIVGINTIVSAEAQGIGFAVSVSVARPVAQDLMGQGRVSYPFLGVSVTEVTPSLATQERLEARNGLFIDTIEPNGPAARAGLLSKDVILALDGTPVKTAPEFLRLLRLRRPGDEVRVSYARGGRQDAATVTLVERPGSR